MGRLRPRLARLSGTMPMKFIQGKKLIHPAANTRLNPAQALRELTPLRRKKLAGGRKKAGRLLRRPNRPGSRHLPALDMAQRRLQTARP
jgi:hypothetical protein